MVKLLTAELRKAYSSYGTNQSAKNQLRGAHLHVAGAFALLGGFVLSLAPHFTSWEKESLTLTFFGAALYVVVHSQDVLAIRTAASEKSASKKSKRNHSFGPPSASNEYMVACLYLIGSLSLSTAVALSNPRWTSVFPFTGKNQFVFAAIMFTFASSLNIVGKKSQHSRKKGSDGGSSTHLEDLARLTFVSGSNFQLTGSVLQLEQFSSQCGLLSKLSTCFSCVGVALQLIGGLINRQCIKTSILQNLNHIRSNYSDHEQNSGKESDDDGTMRRRSRTRPSTKGVMGWFSRNRDARDRSYNSSHHAYSSFEDESPSDSHDSISSDEEAVVHRRERTRSAYKAR